MIKSRKPKLRLPKTTSGYATKIRIARKPEKRPGVSQRSTASSWWGPVNTRAEFMECYYEPTACNMVPTQNRRHNEFYLRRRRRFHLVFCRMIERVTPRPPQKASGFAPACGRVITTSGAGDWN